MNNAFTVAVHVFDGDEQRGANGAVISLVVQQVDEEHRHFIPRFILLQHLTQHVGFQQRIEGLRHNERTLG